GTANGRLHFHAVHFMRTLPTGSVDPNFGRRVRNRRQLNSLQNTWPYGYSMPIHDETGRLNVDGMNIISNDGSNKLNRSRKARVSYKVQRTINASLNAATSTRAVSSNPNFVTRQK